MPRDLPITESRITEHARFEMERRRITEAEIAQVLSSPDQVDSIRPGVSVYQSRMEREEPAGACLLRVFVDLEREPAVVVTAYRTSKICKQGKSDR
jgi:hypothetical protein